MSRGAAIADLEATRAADPLREKTVVQLMHLLVAERRKSDALAAYADLKDHLVEELGLDPQPELRELRDAIVMETYLPPTSPVAPKIAESPTSAAELEVPTRVGPTLEDLGGRGA